MNTTSCRWASTRPDHPSPASKHRTDFAREAAIDAFGPKAIRALDEPDFEDRKPEQLPRHLGQVAAKVINNTGRKALDHWLGPKASIAASRAKLERWHRLREAPPRVVLGRRILYHRETVRVWIRSLERDVAV